MLRWSPYSFIKWLLTLTGSQCLGSSTETHPETKPDLQLGQLGQAQFLDSSSKLGWCSFGDFNAEVF